jgi:hypothetical protein
VPAERVGLGKSRKVLSTKFIRKGAYVWFHLFHASVMADDGALDQREDAAPHKF